MSTKRTYITADLSPMRVNNKRWALAVLRQMLRDVPDHQANYPEGSYTDEELKASLEETRVTDGDTHYYRPHLSAEILFLHPNRLQSHSTETYSKTRIAAAQVLKGFTARGRVIDAHIPAHLIKKGRAARSRQVRAKRV